MNGQYRYGGTGPATPLYIRTMRRRTYNDSNLGGITINKWSTQYTSDTPYSTDGTTDEGATLYKIEHPHGVGTKSYSVSVINTDTGEGFGFYKDLYGFDKHTIWFAATSANITITVIG